SLQWHVESDRKIHCAYLEEGRKISRSPCHALQCTHNCFGSFLLVDTYVRGEKRISEIGKRRGDPSSVFDYVIASHVYKLHTLLFLLFLFLPHITCAQRERVISPQPPLHRNRCYRMKLDTIFKILLVVVILFTIQQIWPLYQLAVALRGGEFFFLVKSGFTKLQTIFNFEKIKKELQTFYNEKDIIPQPTYYIFFLLSGCLTFVLKLILHRLSHPIGEHMIPKKKWSERIRKIKVGRFNLMFFNLFYFSFVSVFGFIALRYQSYFPMEMGGAGNLSEYFADYPNQKTSNLIHLYYFMNGGYLLTSIYSLLISEKLPDFYENILQHLCAIILCFLPRKERGEKSDKKETISGIAPQCFYMPCRVFVDTRNSKTLISLLRVETFTWLIFLLLVILLMNAYWFVLMGKMFVHFIASGNTEDILTRVTEMEEWESKAMGTTSELSTDKRSRTSVAQKS
ncbi:longevity-assurance (LAG1) protein, putative, partial [Plasmodium ovale curtisi]